MSEKQNGASSGQEHYIKSAMQPIEVAQRILSKEQFIGALALNIIKYSMRAGYKDSASKDITKRNQYAYWLDLVKADKVINPITDTVPKDYVFKGLI